MSGNQISQLNFDDFMVFEQPPFLKSSPCRPAYLFDIPTIYRSSNECPDSRDCLKCFALCQIDTELLCKIFDADNTRLLRRAEKNDVATNDTIFNDRSVVCLKTQPFILNSFTDE